MLLRESRWWRSTTKWDVIFSWNFVHAVNLITTEARSLRPLSASTPPSGLFLFPFVCHRNSAIYDVPWRSIFAKITILNLYVSLMVADKSRFVGSVRWTRELCLPFHPPSCCQRKSREKSRDGRDSVERMVGRFVESRTVKGDRWLNRGTVHDDCSMTYSSKEEAT